MIRFLSVFAVALVSCACFGCISNLPELPLPDVSLPASNADVDALRASSDAADQQIRVDLGADIAKVRADSDAADAQLRVDFQATDAAAQAAYHKAIQDGKSQLEAVDAANAARVKDAEDRMAAAIAKARSDAESADAKQATDVSAAKDAAAKAKDDAGNSSPWWLPVGSTLLTLLLGWLGIKKFDAAPFISGITGHSVSEDDMVAAVKAIQGASSKPSPPAP